MFSLSVLFAVNDETNRKHIEDTFKRYLLFLHLLIYGQCGLCPDFKLVVNALIQKLLLERLNELHHQFLPVTLSTFKFVRDCSVLFRLGMPEIDVLHLALYII